LEFCLWMAQNPIYTGGNLPHLKFRGQESTEKVGVRTVERFTPENMGIAVEILSLPNTKPEILKLQPTCVKCHCNMRVNDVLVR